MTANAAPTRVAFLFSVVIFKIGLFGANGNPICLGWLFSSEIRNQLHPEIFGKIFALSSALIVNQIAGLKPETQDPALMLDFDYYERCFGNLDQLKNSENDPEFLVTKHLQGGSRIPEIYMACGTEDFLLKENREFRDFLIQNNVMPDYHESQGIHDWKFWNQYLEPAIEWLTQEEKA